MKARRLAVLACVLQTLKEMEKHPEDEHRATALALIQEGLEFLMETDAPPVGGTSGPDAALEELRAISSRVLNGDPVSWTEVHRMASLAQMLDAFAYDMGALPTVWTVAVAKATEAGHVAAAIAKREGEQ